MTTDYEPVRSLEQQESGEILRLRCGECGRSFSSVDQLARHQSACAGQIRAAGNS